MRNGELLVTLVSEDEIVKNYELFIRVMNCNFVSRSKDLLFLLK